MAIRKEVRTHALCYIKAYNYLQLIFREEQLFIVCDDYVVAEGKGEVKDDRPSFKELYAILMGKVLAILVS